MENEPLFKPENVISTYTDEEAVEDGLLVAINPKDRVTRAVWEFLVERSPKDSKPPNRWHVDMMTWFRAKSNDEKALAMSKGLIAKFESKARQVYDFNVGGGILKVYGIQDTAGKLTSLSEKLPPERATVNDADVYSTLWLIPNENGGVTLMFPEDY